MGGLLIAPASHDADWAAIGQIESIIKTRHETDFARLLAGSGRGALVARIDGVPVGYVVLNRASAYPLFARLGIPELQDLNVIPAYRGRGLGAALVAACEDMARRDGAVRIGLAVGLHKSYGPAQRLYVRLGYQPDGNGITYDRQNIAAGELRPVDDNLCLMMVKDL